MAKSPSPYVTLSVDDGSTMQAFVARPAGRGRHPALLLCQEAFGVNGHIQDVARRCARLHARMSATVASSIMR